MGAGVDLAVFDIEMPGFVIHAIEIAVLEEAVVTAASAFPGGVVFEHDFFGLWLVQALLGFAFEFGDKVVIDEQFTAGADGDGFCGGGGGD